MDTILCACAGFHSKFENTLRRIVFSGTFGNVLSYEQDLFIIRLRTFSSRKGFNESLMCLRPKQKH